MAHMRLINPMNTKTDQELLLNHAKLHMWAKHGFTNRPVNWTRNQVVNEHMRLAGIMRRRGIEHHSPM